MKTIEIRPDLQIHVHASPGTAYLSWWLPGRPSVRFNPADSTFHPCHDGPSVGEILSAIPPADLHLIVERLQCIDRERRASFARARQSSNGNTQPAYTATVFEYLPGEGRDEFWVITAYHPDGRNADATANQAADLRLHQNLAGLGLEPFRIIGLSPDERHAEPGWGVSCDESTAIKLGRKFNQQAVFHFSPGQIRLVDCRTGTHTLLDDPEARIRDPRDVKHFTLFVGPPPDGVTIDEEGHARIRAIVSKRFSGFTIQHGQGWFGGHSEESAIITLATRTPLDVLKTARELRGALNQTGIGISHRGIYQRVREWSDDDLILESFGIAASPQNLDAPEG
jgi:hypothetical protein